MNEPSFEQDPALDGWTYRQGDDEAHPALSDHALTAAKQAFLDGLNEDEEVWFFGYGSLMWNPGFPSLADGVAVAQGWQRRFCVYSHRYRGTPKQPGLVLGLDEGGACTGHAYQVCKGRVREVADYLWDREMVTGIYRPTLIDTEVEGHGHRACWAFVVKRDHSQYAGTLSEAECAALIASAAGNRGSNRDYLQNTVKHLNAIGVGDAHLHEIAMRIGCNTMKEGS